MYYGLWGDMSKTYRYYTKCEVKHLSDTSAVITTVDKSGTEYEIVFNSLHLRNNQVIFVEELPEGYNQIVAIMDTVGNYSQATKIYENLKERGMLYIDPKN